MIGLQIPTNKLLEEYLRFTKDSSASNKDVGKMRIGEIYNQLMELAGNHLMEKTKYGHLKASQRSYLLPPDYASGGLKSVRVKIGDIWYPVEITNNSDQWHRLVTQDTIESTIPTLARVMSNDGQDYIELDPIPNEDGVDNLEVVFEGLHDPLFFPDAYATGTVTITKGNHIVHGAGTTFTTAMARRFIRVNGAKYWHEIKSFNNTTSLNLVNEYQEDTVSGGGYEIAELSRLPAGYSYTPIYGAAEIYFRGSNQDKSEEYGKAYARETLILEGKKSKTKGRVSPGYNLSPRATTPRNYPHTPLGRLGV